MPATELVEEESPFPFEEETVADTTDDEEAVDAAPTDDTEEVRKTRLEFHYFFEPDKNQSMLTLRKNAPISQEDAEILGLTYDKKGEYWWIHCPRDVLSGSIPLITQTFTERNYEISFNWPEDRSGVARDPNLTNTIDGYWECTEAHRIAMELIPKFHPKLAAASIKYVTREYKPRMDDDGNVNYLKLSKVSGVNAWLARHDFVVEICTAVWRALNNEQKKALVDDALAHFTTSRKGKWRKRKSQVAANIEVVQRRGDLDGSARRLADALDSNQTPVQSILSAAKRVVEQLNARDEAEDEF